MRSATSALFLAALQAALLTAGCSRKPAAEGVPATATGSPTTTASVATTPTAASAAAVTAAPTTALATASTPASSAVPTALPTNPADDDEDDVRKPSKQAILPGPPLLPAPPPARAPARPADDEDDDRAVVYTWSDPDGSIHFAPLRDVPQAMRRRARPVTAEVGVVGGSGDRPRPPAEPPPAADKEAPPRPAGSIVRGR